MADTKRDEVRRIIEAWAQDPQNEVYADFEPLIAAILEHEQAAVSAALGDNPES